MTWHAKETLRGFYGQPDTETAADYIVELAVDCATDEMPAEVQSLGRTLRTWRA